MFPFQKAFNDYVTKNQLSGSERTGSETEGSGFMGEETIVDEEEHKIGGGNLKKEIRF